MDTGNKIIVILLGLIAIAAIACGFLYISTSLEDAGDASLDENTTNVTNITNDTDNLTNITEDLTTDTGSYSQPSYNSYSSPSYSSGSRSYSSSSSGSSTPSDSGSTTPSDSGSENPSSELTTATYIESSTSKVVKGGDFSVTLKDNDGNVLSNKSVIFRVGYTSYT